MSNATTNLTRQDHGQVGRIYDLPVAASTHIYEGTLVCQVTATGGLAPYSTASSGWVVGVAQHESDNSSGALGDKRCRVESEIVYSLANGTSSDAFSDVDKIGAPVYGTDDHTAAKTSNTGGRQIVGFFEGFEADGRVRVRINPDLARLYAILMALTDTPATADALRDNIVAGVAT